jgi:hypothetical protein
MISSRSGCRHTLAVAVLQQAGLRFDQEAIILWSKWRRDVSLAQQFVALMVF